MNATPPDPIAVKLQLASRLRRWAKDCEHSEGDDSDGTFIDGVLSGDFYDSLNEAAAALETLAASEPVEAVDPATLFEGWNSVLIDAGEIFANSTDQRIVSRASRIVTWLKAHKPAPEQPGKSEACTPCGGTGWLGGPTYREPDEGGEQCPDCDNLDRHVAPQPSDPAEGDARAIDEGQVERSCQAAYSACDMGNFPNEAIYPDSDRLFVRAALEALSTPPTAAVRIDDAMVERAVKAMTGARWIHMGTADRGWYRRQARAALTAALDPQVKK